MRKIAAQNVAYLLILQKYLTRTMLRPFYESVKKFENKPTTLDETFQEIDVTGQTEKDELNELKKVNRFEMKVEINRIKEWNRFESVSVINFRVLLQELTSCMYIHF